MFRLLTFNIMLAHAGFALSTVPAPQVTINAGTLQGGRCEGPSGASYFKSIPYAQPPVGDLRFEPPQPIAQTYSSKPRQATTSAPACVQFGAEFKETGPVSEDCLYLDIWVPASVNISSRFPVKVWIYGGSEADGGISDPLYDGCNTATDALLVSINYRLGPLGFLALESAGIGGNQGIQDLLLGLDWIQKNIAAFGGDPAKVLLFGQSAGAVNTFVIASLPQAPTLINAAIAESGGGREVQLNATIQKLGANYTQSLNCSITDATCLKSKSVVELTTTFTNLALLSSGIGNDGAIGIGGLDSYQFTVYLDNKIVPTQPTTVGVRVPTIFGSNSEDGSLFALAQYGHAPNGPASATAKDYNTFLKDNFGSAASLIEQYYPLSVFNSTPFPAYFAIATVITDASYKCTAYRGLNVAASKNIPVWTYLFSHVPTCPWINGVPPQALELLGPTHTAEIPFVFGNLDDLPGPNGTCNLTTQEKTISETLMSAWTAMAANGNPSTESLPWPAYTSAQKSLGLNIVNTTQAGYVNYTVCELWDKVNELIVNATKTTGPGTTSPSSVSPAPSQTGSATTSPSSVSSAPSQTGSATTSPSSTSPAPLQTGAAHRLADVANMVMLWVVPALLIGAFPPL